MKAKDGLFSQNSKGGNSTRNSFRIILWCAILLTASICNSCDPDDDDTTDGTSGATSQLNIHHESRSIITEPAISIT